MFSALLSQLAEIIPSLDPAAVSALGAQPGSATRNARVLTEAAPLSDMEAQDWRQWFVGRWDCAGTKVVNGQELPYFGKLHNLWAIEKTWLLLDFIESEPVEGKPFAEHQYWGFTPENGLNTRPMMTSVSGLAVITSSGWVDNSSLWTGTYTVGSVVLNLTEKITILNDDQCRFFGEMFFNNQSAGMYDMTCTRKNHGNGNGHHNSMPTV
jgi:hypothetical protein